MARLYAGTSGFAYPGWKPAFYPAKLASKDFLRYYAERLNGVEINYTFRRLPSEKTISAWIGATPPAFGFSFKAPMRITHILRLKNASESMQSFLDSINLVAGAGKLGAVLFQLPPRFPCDLGLLKNFLSGLPGHIRFAFEFRDPSWLAAPVYGLLEKHGIAVCIAGSERLEAPEAVTAPFLYFRFRKPDYSPAGRKAIAGRVKKFLSQGRDVFAFFKHEETPEGALYAEELLKAV